ncbi:MAG: beta-hydroxyacyl-ACP dehydratase [Burkholderiales bacterium]|nr:beta-hydroxyacyl-ACP dehydratase [Burkholderiales bacterium]
MAATELLPIAAYIPHRGDMLLLDAVEAVDDASIRAALRVSSQAWYCPDAEGMAAWFGIELMAQAIAAHVTHTSSAHGQPPKQGVLLGTRRYESEVPVFACGTLLRIEAREEYRDAAGFAVYDCEIADGTRVLARASIKAFQPEDFGEFLRQAAA